MSFLNLNISLSVMIIIVLLIRRLGDKSISKNAIVGLWNVVLIRALIPYSIPVDKLPIIREFVGKVSIPGNSFTMPRLSENIQKSVSQGAVITGEEIIHGGRLLDALKVVWIFGAICVALYFLRIYYREYKVLKKSFPVQNELAERMLHSIPFRRKVRLFAGDCFSSTITCGILRPKIILPSEWQGISRVDIRNMIAHELVHIRRFDVAKRYLLAVMLCLYWHHPLVWLMYRFYQTDQEMACDEGVLQRMSQENAKSYIYTMIKMSSKSSMHVTFTGFLGKNNGKKRILAAINRTNKKKRYLFLMVPAGIFLLLFFVSFSQNSSAEVNGEIDVATADVSNVGEISDDEVPQMDSEGQGDISERQNGHITTTEGPGIQGETEFVRMSDEEYVRVMTDIIENYNDAAQPLTEEQSRAIRQLHFYTLADEYEAKVESGGKLTEEELQILKDYRENPLPQQK